MKRNLVLIAAFFFLSLGCSSLEKTSAVYLEALEGARSEKASQVRSQKVIEAFERACGLGNQAACLQVDPNREGIRLSRIPILQTATGPTSTQVTVLTEVKARPMFLLWNEKTGQLLDPVANEVANREYSPFEIANLRFENLEPGALYRLEVVTNQGVLLDYRHLKTLKPSPNKLRFALISCMSDYEGPIQESMWRDALSHKPEVLFLIGDTVYADRTLLGSRDADTRQLWERFVETRRALALFYTQELIPSFSVWDDHDTGSGDANIKYPLMRESAANFRTFFPQKAIPQVLVNGPGLSAEVTLAGQRFFFLDDRSFRTPNVNPMGRAGRPAPIYKDEDKKNQAHLGSEQEAWLFAELKKSNTPAWLFMGDQFFGGYHPFESYQGSHPQAFAQFVKNLRTVKAPIVFGSGDRHLAEIIRVPKQTLGYPTYELTSSAIHAKLFPGAFRENPSPNQWVGRDGVYNYMIVTSEALKNGFKLDVTSYGPKNEILFKQAWEVKK